MMEDVRLDLDYNGSIELLLERPTARGHRRLVLTSGQIDDQAEELFARSHCHWLAGAIHSLTGWELVTFDARSETGEWKPFHTAVRTPDGRIVDIQGEHASAEALDARYSQERNGQAVRHRSVPSEHIPGDVLNGDENRGDPLWWARGTDKPTQAAFLHFARLVIQRHAHANTASKPAGHAESGATRRQTTTPTAQPTTGGTTAMSNVDEIRAAVAQAQQESVQVSGALQQAQDGLDRIRQMLAQAFDGSTQTATEEALGALGRARDQFHEVHSLLHIGISAAENYAAVL